MEKSIYAAPTAEPKTHPEFEASEIIEAMIRMAWKAPVGLTGFIVIMTCIALFLTENNRFDILQYTLIGASTIMALSFGIYKKSRICAVLLLLIVSLVCISNYLVNVRKLSSKIIS